MPTDRFTNWTGDFADANAAWENRKGVTLEYDALCTPYNCRFQDDRAEFHPPIRATWLRESR